MRGRRKREGGGIPEWIVGLDEVLDDGKEVSAED